MSDHRIIEGTRIRICAHDYEAVFAHGGCFHFALRLNERFGYRMRGIRESQDGRSLSHVWGLKPDGKGVDIRGVYPEDLLARLANGGEEAPVFDVSTVEARKTITAKAYPAELEAELFKLADWILDNHERFAAAKPVDNNAYPTFLKDIAANSGNPAL
jgi:hypothetical protein